MVFSGLFCWPSRILRFRVFDGLASLGLRWFLGFKIFEVQGL